MKQLIKDLYYESQRDLNNIKKSKMALSDRLLLEKALVRLEDMKKIMDYCNITPQN